MVINCTGGGATSLVTDPHLKLVKGQTVKVMAPSITEFVVAMDGPLSLACKPPSLLFRVCGTLGVHQILCAFSPFVFSSSCFLFRILFVDFGFTCDLSRHPENRVAISLTPCGAFEVAHS